MATTRYEVHEHYYGRPRVQHGGAQGLPDFPQHKWVRITTRRLGLVSAKALADAREIHTVVMVANSNTKVYDNGKAPGLPQGWLPADAPSTNPSNLVRTARDERLWEKAKEIVAEEYRVHAGSRDYWQLVNGVFQRMKLRVGGGAQTPRHNPKDLLPPLRARSGHVCASCGGPLDQRSLPMACGHAGHICGNCRRDQPDAGRACASCAELHDEVRSNPSADPIRRAQERIAALSARGGDPVAGTLRRIQATRDTAKLEGIRSVARAMVSRDSRWRAVLTAVEAKLRGRAAPPAARRAAATTPKKRTPIKKPKTRAAKTHAALKGAVIANPTAGVAVAAKPVAHYKVFHGVDPNRVLDAPKAWRPGPLVLIGDGVDVGYGIRDKRSTKDGWYVHTFGKGVKVFRRAKHGETPSRTYKSFPQDLMVLGYNLGYTVRPKGQQKMVEVKGSTKKWLAVIGPSGVEIVMTGGNMRVEDWIRD